MKKCDAVPEKDHGREVTSVDPAAAYGDREKVGMSLTGGRCRVLTRTQVRRLRRRSSHDDHN